MNNLGAKVKTAFGLDIAGYSTGKSGFARADLVDKNHIEVTVYEKHIFANKITGEAPIKDITEKEKQILVTCLGKGPLFVDIPIDLQGLPYPKKAKFVWELINRPVDFAFDALPPLANLIGSPVARFFNLFSSLQEDAKYQLGKQIFETYPAGSLMLLNLPNKNYKKQKTEFINGIWKSKKEGNLSQIAKCLKLTSEKKITLNDDDIDAIICAITGIVDENHLLQGDEIGKYINRSISNGELYPAPAGYVLLKSLPNMKICIVRNHKELLEDVAR